MSRILAIDYGTRRIGLAVSDPRTRIATPIKQLPGTGRPADDAAAVLRVADEYDAVEFLVGLPLNMDGTEGPQAQLARAFANKLRSLTTHQVLLWDERLSSHAADSLLSEADLTRKQTGKRRDAVAAHVILQSYLDRDSVPPVDPAPP